MKKTNVYLQEDEYTDEWGVTYCSYGRILKSVDSDQFTCEEYTIPEGVEVIEGEFWDKDSKLKKIHLPSTLRTMEANTFIHCPIEEIELPEGLKADDQMEWLRRMNSIWNRAEEIVLHELIYV